MQVLPLVVQALPMLSQRATYIRAFIWAMPERCQQVGVAANGVDIQEPRLSKLCCQLPWPAWWASHESCALAAFHPWQLHTLGPSPLACPARSLAP